MNQYLKQCIAIMLVLPAIYLVWFYVGNQDMTDLVLEAVLVYCMVPITVIFAYMWLGDDGGRYLNGFYGMSPEDRDRFAKYYGIWGIVATVIMTVGLKVLIGGNLLWGLVVTFAPIILYIIPLVIGRKNIKDRHIPLESCSGGTKAAITVLVAVITLIPFVVIDDSVSSSVTIDFGEDSFTVKAPMFDNTFSYDEIDTVEYVSDFDKGRRVWGYGTPEISSGEFQNDFGRYQLAAYTKVTPCIVIFVNSEMYAFNQSSVESTQAAYDMLLSKLP